MRKGKLVRHVPNLLTFANLLFGLMAVLLLFQIDHIHKVAIVSALILLGAVADLFDGACARKLGVASDFGKQLDSFADIITFGIAPIGLINYLSVREHPLPLLIASAVYVVAGAYRLARFNLGDFKDYFMGLPIPPAGISLTVYCALYPFLTAHLPSIVCTAITAGFIVLLAVLMLSKKKLKRII